MTSVGPRRPDLSAALVVDVPLTTDWPADGLGDLGVIVAALPEASDVEPGRWVLLRAEGARASGLSRLLGRRARAGHPALLGAALLARGFERVGAGPEGAWGRSPRQPG
jgi:hypothetical protein